MEINDKAIKKDKDIGLGDVVRVSFETEAVYYLIAFDVINEYCLINLNENKVVYRNGGLEYIIEQFNDYDWEVVDAELNVSR